MATRNMTIELTPKQKEKIRSLTGQAHVAFRVEVDRGRTTRAALCVKAAPISKIAVVPDGGGAARSGLRLN